jgi:VWFA-related protein
MRSRLRSNKVFWSIAVLATLIQASTINSQTTPRGQEPSQNSEIPAIKVTTRLVQVNVVVHDKKGEPVGDLTKDDFILLDKGQEQKIQFFSKESSETVPTNTPPLPPGVVSNRYTNFTSGGQSHLAPLPTALTVILLDGLNTAFTDQHYAKEALIKFLNQIQPGDRVAIYTLTNGLRVLHDFTADTESLLAVLAKHRNQESSALSASSYDDANTGDDNLDAFLDRSNDAIANFYQARRVETTLSALEAIARHLAGMPGRKNLIWLSGGFPVIVGQNVDGSLSNDFQTFSDQIQRAMRTINDVGLAIYPVDARGLMGPFATMPSMSPSSRGGNPNRRGPQPVDQRAQNQMLQTQGTMREIADGTGGRAFINTNDLTGAIRRAMSDARVTYVLAYTPSHDQWDGKFREIKIKLKRPSLEARYRKGYYAYPENPTNPQLRQAILRDAAVTPLQSTGLSLLARVSETPSPDNRRTDVRLVMDAGEIATGRNADGKHEATIDLLLIAFDDTGKVLHQVGRTMQLSLDEEQYTQLRKNGIVLDLDSEAPEKSTRVRLIAHDVSSGSVGSIDLPFK